MKDRRIKEGSVVQANERAPQFWRGCLLIVSEVNESGVVAYMKVPNHGETYVRLGWYDISYIGEAKLRYTFDIDARKE